MKSALAKTLLAAALLAGGLTAGCSPREAKALAQRTSPGTNAWNWENYPPTARMRIGVVSCLLQPRSTISVASPMTGLLKVYAASPQTNLPAGFLWAEFEPEIFAAEEHSLAESLKKLEDREKMEWEVEFPRRKMQLARQIEEAQRQVLWMRVVSTNRELADLMFNTGPNGTSLRPDSLNQSEMELRLLEQSMSYLQSTNHAALGVDLAGERNDWERRKLEFDRRQVQARFRMPFAGRLTLNIPLSDGVTEYPVTAGQELGVARDLSAMRLRVPLEKAAWTGLPADRLTAIVRVADRVYEARFNYQKIERNQNREEPVYYFELPVAQAADASKLVGANVSCELWLDLWEQVRIVPKLALILQDPNAFESQNWASALTQLFPGARLVVEGQTDLAVALPREVKLSSAR